jgi:hypothetical protein
MELEPVKLNRRAAVTALTPKAVQVHVILVINPQIDQERTLLTPRPKKVSCPNCEGLRNCEEFGEIMEVEDYWEDLGMLEHTRWRLLKCAGCDHVFVDQTTWISMDPYEDDPEPGKSAKRSVWPSLSKRPLPKWFKRLSKKTPAEKRLRQVIEETYKAYNQNLLTLTSIGLRTCFDLATESLGIPTHLNFRAKLDELVKKGLILQEKKKHLEVLVDSGSASAHRGHAPADTALEAQFLILEDFLHSSFVLPEANRILEGRLAEIIPEIPKREGPPKKS